jgi:hypothetical protein
MTKICHPSLMYITNSFLRTLLAKITLWVPFVLFIKNNRLIQITFLHIKNIVNLIEKEL